MAIEITQDVRSAVPASVMLAIVLVNLVTGHWSCTSSPISIVVHWGPISFWGEPSCSDLLEPYVDSDRLGKRLSDVPC